MKNRLGLTLALTLVGAFAAQRTHAQTLDFYFSFTSNVPAGVDGTVTNVDGTVTGELFGLTNNAYSSPTDITILSAPAGLDITTPYITSFYFGQGGFTVANGAITYENFDGAAYGGPPGPYVQFFATYNILGIGDNQVEETQSSFNPAVFTAAPEPSPFGLLVVGAAAFVLWKMFPVRSFLRV
jgi:hypothetical protein